MNFFVRLDLDTKLADPGVQATTVVNQTNIKDNLTGQTPTYAPTLVSRTSTSGGGGGGY